MSTIAVIGGTGYAGRHIVAEAADRGHSVLSVARKVAAERIPGVTYIEGTLLDVPSLLAELPELAKRVAIDPAAADLIEKAMRKAAGLEESTA